MNIKYKLFLVVIAFFCIFKNTYASTKYCDVVSGEIDYVIHLSDFTISAAADRLSVISESSIEKSVQCSAPSSIKKLRAIVNNIPIENKTGITINSNVLGLGATIDGNDDCPILKTENTGIGIVWFNHNTYSDRWYCGTQLKSWGRDLRTNGTVTITDKIYLIKIGPITPGKFSYTSNQFTFNEYSSTIENATTAQMTNNGLLYNIRFDSAEIIVDAPVCSILDNINDNYEVSTKDSLVPSNEFSQKIKFHCDGYIEKESPVKFNLRSSRGALVNNSSYYATSIIELGTYISYSNGDGESQTQIYPSNNSVITTKTNDDNGNGNFYLHFKPLVTNNSGHYPLVDQGDISLIIEQN